MGCTGAEGDLTAAAVLKVQLVPDRKCQNLTPPPFFPAQLREKRKCFYSCKSVIKVKVWLLGVRNATAISITAVKAGKNLNIPKGIYM